LTRERSYAQPGLSGMKRRTRLKRRQTVEALQFGNNRNTELFGPTAGSEYMHAKPEVRVRFPPLLFDQGRSVMASAP
jgi:hypothetical protein